MGPNRDRRIRKLRPGRTKRLGGPTPESIAAQVAAAKKGRGLMNGTSLHNTLFGSAITLEPRGLEIREDIFIDADPDVVDQWAWA